jgi:hypothetical protein
MTGNRTTIFSRLALDTVLIFTALLLLIVVTPHVAGHSPQSRFADLFTSAAHAGDLAKPVAEGDNRLIAPRAMTTADNRPSAEPGTAAFGTRDAARQSTMIGLAAVFSLLVAFNLAFFRHLRRVYASPRRGGWRRG